MADIHTPIPALKLSHGGPMPMLAYGTGTIFRNPGVGGHDVSASQMLVDAVKAAISLGYHHLDCAEVYKNEAEVGIAIRYATLAGDLAPSFDINRDSGVAREKLFITTKVLQTIDDVPKAIETSLRKLQLDYVDLYLIHEDFSKEPTRLQSTWKQMEELLASGQAKAIGVSNFSISSLDAILQTAQTRPAVNQIEFHPYRQAVAPLLEYHKKHGIATQAYSALVPITNSGAREPKPWRKTSPPTDNGPIDGFVAALAKKYAVYPAEILLRYCIDQDIAAVTTSTREQRLSDYLRAMTFKLTPREIREISELGATLDIKTW